MYIRRISYLSILCIITCIRLKPADHVPLIVPINHTDEQSEQTIQDAFTSGMLRQDMHKQLIYTHRQLASLNHIESLGDSLHANTITKVDFSHNKLKTIPTTFFSSLPNVVFIDLSHNQLELIETPVPQHKNLETLLLHNNNFKTFPLEAVLTAIALKQLTLHNNQIASYETINNTHESLKELWIDPHSDAKRIALHCIGLEAEICDQSKDVATALNERLNIDYHSTRQLKFITKCGALMGAAIGAATGLGYGILPPGILLLCTNNIVPSIYKECNESLDEHNKAIIIGNLVRESGGIWMATGTGSGLLLGAGLCCIGFLTIRACYPKLPYKKVPQYPGIIEQLKENTTNIV